MARPWSGRPALMIPAAFLGGSAAVVAAPQPAVAEEADVRFDIPAGDLAAALEAYGRQAGRQILFPYDAAAGRQSTRVHGAMLRRLALERLLRGSGLEIVRFDARLITLRRSPAKSARRRPARREQQLPAPLPPAPPPQDIIVTGRLGPALLTGTEASYAVSEIGQTALIGRAALSTADVFKEVPGFWVEATGGEASNNVRVRGIPTDGYSSVALLEDGLPVQYDGGLAYLNTDQSYRVDASVMRAEAIRGGPSAVFLANAPGGGLNFITRDPVADPGHELRVTASDRGLLRVDGLLAQSLNPDLGVLLAGFWRRDPGLRDPGFTADEGGQFRARAVYDDGGTRLSLDLRHLDDSVILYLPVPLALRADGSIAAIPGFDPLYDTLAGPDTRELVLQTARGPYAVDLSEGTHSRVTSLTFLGRHKLGEDAAVELQARWHKDHTLRNALFPVGSPMTAEEFVARNRASLLAAFPGSSSVAFRYAADGSPFGGGAAGNGLVMSANLLSVDLPLEEAIVDARMTAPFALGGQHGLALGGTWARTSFGFDREMGTLLLDVRGQARRLDLAAMDDRGAVTGSLTNRGFLRYGSLFDSARITAGNLALYAADEWRFAPRWRMDIGARLEQTSIRGHAAGKTLYDLGDPYTLADDAVSGSDGSRLPIRHRYSGFNWSVGLNFEAADNTGLFVRYSCSRRLPSASAFNDPARTDHGVVPITLLDAGLTMRRRHWRISAVAFYTHFDHLPFTDYRFDTASNAYVERTSIADTSTAGIEFSGSWRPSGPFSIEATATLQDPRYRNFSFTELVGEKPVTHDASGNQLVRVPRAALRLRPELDLFNGTLQLGVEFVRYSQRFADIANSQRLPAYSLVNASVAWKPNASFSLTVDAANLANSLGVTEGNPRAGSFHNSIGQGEYFFARPEFGRTVRVTMTVR
ncbi:TonB-dependent receptor [Novosphingobium indicum]|nr:TonB-dependent receptor [Novosphingobium indicum]